MIFLASFPRSGNTFLRNVLYEVYGCYSWNNLDRYERAKARLAELQENGRKVNKVRILRERLSSMMFKTHELPANVRPPLSADAKVIYLVRDGRDALVSMAHHRSDIVAPGSDFRQNLIEAIQAPISSHFGGWSRNIDAWLKRADKVIRFTDLISSPIETVNGLSDIIDLGEPQLARLPTFESQRQGLGHFGPGHRDADELPRENPERQSFFRRGQVGGWRDDMPEDLHELFWQHHGNTMLRLGFEKDTECLS